ncbi:MAG: hypothetical protein RLZZ437_1584 [Pseudomonadota bacterium]|jgi:hypothetical protein
MQDAPARSNAAAPTGSCPTDCKEAMALANREVDAAKRIADPVKRNAAITKSYRDLAKAAPNNHWVRLAGYVSTQGGCAMKKFYASETWTGVAAQSVGRAIVNPEDALDTLKDANTTIFASVYPPNKFMQTCGYRKLKECVDKGEVSVDPKLMAAFAKMDAGQYQTAADMIAQHEQVDVVQPVYERHKDTFDDMMTAEAIMPGDQTSIPVSYSCDGGKQVSLGDLELQSPTDRVKYYKKLMDEMKRIEGIR